MGCSMKTMSLPADHVPFVWSSRDVPAEINQQAEMPGSTASTVSVTLEEQTSGDCERAVK